ncbi:MAG: hypothetical protein WCD82_07490 [Xanthobacteraceae bacterium]
MTKKLQVGQRQASRICQMSMADRLAFIAEGLPSSMPRERILLNRLIAGGRPQESATQDHVDTLYRHWPLPIYNVDFSPVPVTLDELKAEQDRLYWADVGDP